MKKLFYLMCLLPLALTGCKNAPRIFDVMDGPGMVNEQFMSLDKIESEWKGGDIPVQNGSERPSVIDLLTAVNELFPSFGVDSLLRKLNEPGFEGEYYAEDGTGTIQHFPSKEYVLLSTETDAESVEASVMRRENGHSLFVCSLNKPTDPVADFHVFYDYDPQTKTLTPEDEPWKKVSPAMEGNTLIPSCNLFDGVFLMGEFNPDDTLLENPIYCHTFEFDGQDIVYTGYQANIPEDEEGE